MRTPYALLLNDIHINRDNIEEFRKNWDEAIELCLQRKITRIIVGGDLWTNRAAQTLPVLLAVREALLDATDEGISVVLAEGNHDLIDQEDYAGYSHVFSGYNGVIVVDDYELFWLDKPIALRLAVMSYFPENGSFIDRLNELRKRVKYPERTILYIHQGIKGGLSQSSDDELPSDIFKDFRKVLVGHYHDRKRVGENIFYIGASRQHNFGEDQQKGYTIIYDDGETEFVLNKKNTRYSTIVITDRDDMENTMLMIPELTKNGEKVRVQVECNSDEAKTVDKQALLNIGATKVEIKTETITVESAAQAMETKYDKAGIKKEYVVFCQSKNISDIEVGLNYLDKIN